MLQQVVPQGQLGNRYKAFTISILDGTTDWSLCENNAIDFPDWNENWNNRDYWTILIIKQLTGAIHIKFHGKQYNQIRIVPGDSPAIFEHIVYRDIYITNNSGSTADFDIILVNNRTISPPPFKPENLEVTSISSNSIKLNFNDSTFYNDNFSEDYFKIERSTIGPISGFSQINTVTMPVTMYTKKPIKIEYIDNSCISGTQYWYRIKAYSQSGGDSPFSNVATTTTL